MINNVKDNIYSFFKSAMVELYPAKFPVDDDGFSEKIFWKKSRDEEPQKPYIILDDVIKGKLNKSFEQFSKGGKTYKRENWGMTITFGVYTQGTEGDFFAEDRFALDYIETIEDLFNSQSTFDALSANGIIVNEKQISGIRELSQFAQTNYSYRYEIDVRFEFDKVVQVIHYGTGEKVNLSIKAGNDENQTINVNIGD